MGAEIIPFDFYTISSVGRGKFLHGEFVHNSCQSMCYDSRNQRYIVGFAMPDNVSALVKMKDLSFADSAVEMFVTKLPLDHCNDLVYSPEDHRIYCAGGNSWIAVINPENLEVERKIPIPLVAWSLARYPNGDFFVHEDNRGERFTHDFSSSVTVSDNDRDMIAAALGGWSGCWQGAICIDGQPYMIYNEYSNGKPVSIVLFSCEPGSDRTIYRAETGHEIESADYVGGKMMIVYNEPYRYGGCSWEMSEINMKMVDAEFSNVDLPANKEVTLDLSKRVPDGYELISANVILKKCGSSIRVLPYVNTDGTCLVYLMKINKNKVIVKSRKAYTGNGFIVTGFCRKKQV